MFINKTHLSPVYKPVIRERHAYCQLYIAMIRDREDNQQICGNFRLNALTHKSIPLINQIQQPQIHLACSW